MSLEDIQFRRVMSRSNQNPASTMFVVHVSDTNVALNFMQRARDEFGSYGDAYRRAAQVLFREHFVPKTRNDLDVLPMAFLYRHAAELYLKSIIRRGNNILELYRKPPVAVQHHHSLARLLDDVHPIFAFMKWTWDAGVDGFRSFDDFRKCMLDLERDDVLDTDDTRADMWRYPVRKDGTDALPHHFGFDVHEFVGRIEVLVSTLSGASSALDVALDAAYESISEARAAAEAECDASDGAYESEGP